MIIKPSTLGTTVALAAVGLLPQLVNAQEWTRFRGPNGSGIGDAPSMPAKFNEADFEWIIELPGTGHSSPVLWGKKLFLTVAASEEAERRVLCYDSTSGEQIWEWSEPFEEYHKHQFNDFASATPVVDEHAVYMTWTSGRETRALALDHNGKKLWEDSWKGFSSDHGSAASPILVEGTLVLHTDALEERKSYLYGINPSNGEQLWSRERISPPEDEKHLTAYSTPVVSSIGGRTCVVFLSTNDGWMGVDPKNGEELWHFRDAYKFRSVGSIAEDGGVLFATMGSGDSGKQAAALRLKSDGEVEQLFSFGSNGDKEKNKTLSYVPTPILHDGLLYLWKDNGQVTCMDALTGEVIYSERIAGGQYFSSPVLVDGKIYGANRHGVMVVVKAGREFEVLAENKLDSGVNATPAIANGRMFIRTDTHLMSLKGGS
ncbi:MAG: PQQ-binding-like beta-propeller repeat protein [Verrucomicrobiae bacterium]|nr:PQQ-binding-like beta-propeller repeat protein [Verrucomicrobiae bacterium]